ERQSAITPIMLFVSWLARGCYTGPPGIRSLPAGAAYRRARDLAESRWADQPPRLAIISGKEALSRLSEWCRAAYRVTFGAAAVWRAFKLDEIPAEMADVLPSIESGVPFPAD